MNAPNKNKKIIDADLKEIMPTFLANREKDLSLIAAALESSDFKGLQVIGHKLAGNAGSYGLPDLGEIGAQIEMASIKNDLPTLKSLYQQYVTYMKELEIEYQ